MWSSYSLCPLRIVHVKYMDQEWVISRPPGAGHILVSLFFSPEFTSLYGDSCWEKLDKWIKIHLFSECLICLSLLPRRSHVHLIICISMIDMQCCEWLWWDSEMWRYITDSFIVGKIDKRVLCIFQKHNFILYHNQVSDAIICYKDAYQTWLGKNYFVIWWL